MRTRLLFLLPLTGCAAATATAQPAPQIAEMMATDRQFDADTAAEGAEGWVRYFAPNGVMLLGDAPAIAGHDAIRKAMSAAFGRPGASLRWQPTEGGVFVDDTLGYTVGRYESRHDGKDGEPVLLTGTYISIWRRQKDGSWKAVFDTGAPDAPPAAAAPAKEPATE